MKKFLLILGMITCMLGVAACGKPNKVELSSVTPEWVDEKANELVANIVGMVEGGNGDLFIEQGELTGASPAYIEGVKSYMAARAEIGSYLGIEDINYEEENSVLTIWITIKGSERNAEIEFVTGQDEVKSITTTAIYSTSEIMTKAGLNTLMGMGTVFVVLILIALIISAFSLIPKIQKIFSKKEKKTETAVANAVAQIVENEEAQEDDLELIAVIAAAIAASEGAASADGYVVRSIRKIR